jgi:hypothetical protein
MLPSNVLDVPRTLVYRDKEIVPKMVEIMEVNQSNYLLNLSLLPLGVGALMVISALLPLRIPHTEDLLSIGLLFFVIGGILSVIAIKD